MPVKACPRCGYESPPPGNKYCNLCEPKVKAEMRRSGYLTKVPNKQKQRSQDAQEDTNETKFGVDD